MVLDHVERTAWLLALDAPDAADWLGRPARAVTRSGTGSQPAGGNAPSSSCRRPPTPAGTSAARDTEAGYKRKIADAQHEIAEGNSYEVCLTTTPLRRRLPATAVTRWPQPTWPCGGGTRRRSPATCASAGLTVASTSPERFLRIASDGGMRAEPIKGTRRRAADPEPDAAAAARSGDLAQGPGRKHHDRGPAPERPQPLRRAGSVTVSRLCEIESYATVHQLVSTIDARLLPGSPRAEAVAACFPAGSMTGAPKISTMAILDRLEDGPRGVYSGAIGYFSLNGATDLAVAIRTLVVQRRRRRRRRDGPQLQPRRRRRHHCRFRCRRRSTRRSGPRPSACSPPWARLPRRG